MMGVLLMTPNLPRLLDVVERNEKMRSRAREKSLRKYVITLIAKVNIVVTRGQQLSYLAETGNFFGNAPLFQQQKKTF